MKRIFLLFFISLFGVSFAQKKYNSLADLKGKNIKVGLVLSGGGAKGLAHIAVLEAIEKAGVRINYIGGTSMGAIVGGLYASGYSAHQLDSIFRTVDFEELIQDNVPRSAQNFYEKANRDRYMVSLTLQNGKLMLPSAISKGNNLYNFLRKLTYPTRHIEDFSKFPIPFLCVATDVETGQQVVLEHGDLAQSIMASGAFPTLFSPMDIDGKWLTDGGILNNYPVDEVRAKGMDVIIGVDVQAPLKNRAELQSADKVLMQITSYKIANDMEEKKEKTDIYIKPNMEGYNVISFEEGFAIIDSGRVAVKNKISDLEYLAHHQKKKDKEQIQIKDSLYVSAISFTGNNHYTDQYLRGKLGFQWGKKISFDDLNIGVQNILATQNFKSVKYHICPTPSGEELYFNLQEAPQQTWVKLSLHYDNLYKTAALVNISKSNFLQKDDLFSFDFIVGDNIRYKLDYYVDKGFYTSYGFRSKYDRFRRDITFGDYLSPTHTEYWDRGDTSVELDTKIANLVNQVYIQSIFDQKFLVGVGLEHHNIIAKTKTEQTTTENTHFYSPYAYIRFDSLNDRMLPTSGAYFDVSSNWYLFSGGIQEKFEQFVQTKIDFGGAWHFTPKVSAKAMASLGFVIGNPNTNSLKFVLGGYGYNMPSNYISFVGYDYLSFGSYEYWKLATTINYRFYKKNYLDVIVNFANAQKDIFKTNQWISFPKYSGYGIGITSQTFLGNLSVKATYSPETDRVLWLFSIGYWF
ncbi:MAG: patatin-like phospholipase family protein [Capnocytophaga sp.]|nr:patatin-like phospholipase family protein [Capnocytophaga sp.]